jgi:UDP-GlcNAc:undecaprenyl-phosphate GlcNAc-1-phosphate transferase
MSPLVYGAFFCVAALLSLGAVRASRVVSLRFGAVDHGGGRRVHQGVVPRLGGLGIYAVWAGITIAALVFFSDPLLSRRLTGILAGSLLLLAVGWYDDIRSASVRLKIAVQVAAAVVVYCFGVRIVVLSNPVGDVFHAGWMDLPLTVLWLVVITNAFNLIDGIDGLAATTGVTICVGMLLLYTGSDSLGRLAIVTLAGALVGFLRHNLPPARIFMGDSGSQSVGFLLGALSLLSFSKATTLAALVLPLVVFGHPLVDMGFAVLRRYHRGQPLGVADREHLHHLLLDRGFSGQTALGILVLLNLGLLGLVLLLANSRISGILALLALLTIPAGVALRILRHILAGGSFRKEALAFFMSAQRRRVLYQVRLFGRMAPAAGSRSALDELIRTFARRTGLSGVRIALRVAGERERPLFRDEAHVSGNRFTVCLTVLRECSNFELLVVSMNRDRHGRGSLSDAAHALAAGIRGYLETEAAAGQLSPPVDETGAPAATARRPRRRARIC